MMRVSLDLELKDIPGQLVAALKPISEHGGNVRSIIHYHDKRTPRNTIPVKIIFDIEEGMLPPLLDKLGKDGNISVVRVGKEKLVESVLAILIGHVIRSDVRDIINQIDSTGFAEVVDMSVSMPGITKHSSALLKISATGKEELTKALEILERLVKKKNLLLVTQLREPVIHQEGG